MASKKSIAPVRPKGKTTRTAKSHTPKAAPEQEAATTPQAPAVPLRPRQLPPEKRRIPHYTLVCSNGQYVHENLEAEPVALTTTIRNAYFTDSFLEVTGIREEANNHTGPWGRAWQHGPLEVYVADVEFNGCATGSHPWHGKNDYDSILSRASLTKFQGSMVNTALAQVADIEENTLDPISYIHTSLSSSIMFMTLALEYKNAVANPEGLEPDWYLAEFASRCFYGGVIAGRREQGRRTPGGELLLDDAGTKYKGPVTPQAVREEDGDGE